MKIEFSELFQTVENYQPMRDLGFILSYKGEKEKNSWLVYKSQWCKFKINLYKDFHHQVPDDSLMISYGRVHALDESITMEYNGQIYSCWLDSVDLRLVYKFLDGLSPEETFKNKFEPPKWRINRMSVNQNNEIPRNPSNSALNLHKAIWDYYELRFFELLDIRRPDLWNKYINFLKEYAKLQYGHEEKESKRLKQVFNIPEIPLYQKI